MKKNSDSNNFLKPETSNKWRKQSIAVAPAPLIVESQLGQAVIDIASLGTALHPNSCSISGKGDSLSPSESRGTTPSYVKREPVEITFLKEVQSFRISHQIKDECFSCSQKLEFLNDHNISIMRATKDFGCSHQNYEIFHEASGELVILIEIVDASWSCLIPESIQVYGPPGRSLGFVDKYSACGANSYFEIRNSKGEPIYTSEPKFNCLGPTQYPVICNQSPGKKVAEVLVNSNYCFCSYDLTTTFTSVIPPSHRALILGLALLIDIMEQQKRLRLH